MPLEKLNGFTKKVQDLADKPNATMSAAEVKAQFDAAPDEVRQYLNKLIDGLSSVVDGDSGADNIGATAIAGLSGETVQTLLESLKALDDTNKAYLLEQIQGAVSGQIPDGSITDVKLSNESTGIKQALTTHKVDLTSHVPFGVDTGTANAKVVTLSPAPTSLVKGAALAFENLVTNTGAVTINVNGFGVVPVVKQNGNALSNGNMKAGLIYTVRKGTTSFILQGEGGEIPKLPNLVRNGGFENGLVNWDVTMNATSVLTPVKNGSKSAEVIASNSRAYLGVARDGVFFVPKANSKYYMSGNFYVKSYSIGSPAMIIRATAESLDTVAPIDTTKLNQWQFKSLLFDSTGKTLTTIDYFAIHDGAVATSVFDIVADGIMILNLTDAYGAGLEPSKEDMDAMVQANNGWWDNDLVLLTTDATATSLDILNTKTAYVNGSKLTGTLSPGKKWARGSGTPSSNTLTINGLNFIPSIVIVKVKSLEATTNGNGNYSGLYINKSMLGSLYDIVIRMEQGTFTNTTCDVMLGGFSFFTNSNSDCYWATIE